MISPERLSLELAASLPRIDLIGAGDHMLRRQLSTRERLNGFLPRRRPRRLQRPG
ncbi:hypothetical protein [Actinomadura madurae]|uniref:hypothetical protein n=1 Tax=Actinomadura madurae TaxID=1993 RepID=UPI0020D21AC8|nr:hypothetical protein [Actinomadura madurae]MCP9951559.1 hypothetical protein [Actinomadura madurae]MCP9980796.1 hypothetical protein [Actinomadura madurae]